MPLPRIPRPALFFLAMVLLFPSPGSGDQGARLTDIKITNSPSDILLYFRVANTFSPEIQEAVKSGIPTTFSYFITLEKIRSFWRGNKTVADITLTHEIKYNRLKKEFTVTRSWEDDTPIFTADFADARRLMTEIHGFRLFPVDRLEKGSQYRVCVKAKLSKVSLPFYLRYFLMLASVWNFETEWHELEFEY